MPRKTEEQQEQDSAYRMGYMLGYHRMENNNPYSMDDEAQLYIKYKMGYTAGKMLHEKENRA